MCKNMNIISASNPVGFIILLTQSQKMLIQQNIWENAEWAKV